MSALRLARLAGPLAALLASAACAASASFGAPPAAVPLDAEGQLQVAVTELERRKAELENVARANDCGEVCRLSSLICVASERICEISARNADREDFAGRCRSAQGDCGVGRNECDRCNGNGGSGG